jgi:hypothetical protein
MQADAGMNDVLRTDVAGGQQPGDLAQRRVAGHQAKVAGDEGRLSLLIFKQS